MSFLEEEFCNEKVTVISQNHFSHNFSYSYGIDTAIRDLVASMILKLSTADLIFYNLFPTDNDLFGLSC